MYDVLVLGDYFYDLIFTGLEAFPVLGQEKISKDLVTTGGGAYSTVCALHRLGVHVGWRAHFGSDEYSEAIFQLARQEGIDMSISRRSPLPYRRVTAALPLHGERAFVTHVDPAPEDKQEFWMTALRDVRYRHVHLGGALPEERIAPIATLVHQRGATLSMDCADVPLLYNNHAWQDTIMHLDVFMPNAREARLITRADGLEAAMQRLLEWCPVVVVKDGANGALVGGRDDSSVTIVRAAAIDAGACVDTTGAGDCFNAGFLYGWVKEKAPLSRCALYGNICGGLSVTGEGGATAAPDLDMLLAWAAKLA